MFSATIIFAIIIILLDVVLGFTVLFRSKRRGINLVFALLTFFVAIWIGSNTIVDIAPSHDLALLATRITFFSTTWAMFLLFCFAVTFPRVRSGSKIKILLGIYFVLTTFLSLISLTDLIIKNVRLETWGGYSSVHGSLVNLYLIFLTVTSLWSIGVLSFKQRKAIGIEKLQLRYTLAGFSIAVFSSIVLSVVIPLLTQSSRAANYVPVSILIFVAFTTYAIIKHRLLDIVVIIKRATIFFILLSIILGIFSAVAFGLPAIFAEGLPPETYQAIMVAIAFIVALFFQPLRKAIEETTDKWFFKGAYKAQDVIDQLSEKISTIIDLRVLLDSTARILLSAFRADHAVFAVREKIGNDRGTTQNNVRNNAEDGAESTEFVFRAYNMEGRHHGDEDFGYDNKHPFTKYFTKYPAEIVVKDELQREVEETAGSSGKGIDKKTKQYGKRGRNVEGAEIRIKTAFLKEMERHDFSILFSVVSKDSLVGIFGMGEKKSGDIYSTQDIKLLELYSHQVGIAIENAKLYSDMRLFNERLQLEVEKATQDIRLTNSELTLRNKDLASIQKITNTITRTLDLSTIMQTIANSIHTELGYAGGIIFLYDKEKGTMRAGSITLTPMTQKAIALLPISPYDYAGDVEKDQTLNIKTLKTGEIQIDTDFSKFISPPVPVLLAKGVQKIVGVKTVVAVPIFSEEASIGVINFGLEKSKGEITDTEIQMMKSLADQMGIVIRNVRLYEAVKGYSEKLEEANAYLRELDQTKSEFISIASHQLRSPMTGIKGYLSMLISGDFGEIDAEKKGILQQLFDSSERLIRLINIFLNVSRIEAGRLHLDKRETHIEDVIESVIKEMTQPAKTKGIELFYAAPKKGSIPAFVADPDKLRDVVLNFVDNAIKYTEKGKIQVSASLETRPKALREAHAEQRGNEAHPPAGEAGNNAEEKGIVVRVSDTGIGLSPEEAKKLFDKFSRVKGIAQINPDGSGLGLYIAKKLSEAHGGGVWVESKGKGKGSTFAMWVPMEAKP